MTFFVKENLQILGIGLKIDTTLLFLRILSQKVNILDKIKRNTLFLGT